MKPSHFTGLALGTLLLAAPFSLRGQIIDQQQTDHSGGNFNYLNGNYTGETFVPSMSTVAGAGLYLTSAQGSGPTTLTFQLFSGSSLCGPNPCVSPASYNLSGSPLGSGSATISGSGWNDVFFSSPVNITPGSTYFLLFTGSTGGTVYNTTVSGSGDPYPAGERCYSGASAGPYTCVSSADLAFREYAASPVQSVTPEPSSVALLGTGLLAVAPLARRRKR